jgi:hypothetical protein
MASGNFRDAEILTPPFSKLSVFYHACSSAATFWTFPKVFTNLADLQLLLLQFGLEGFVCKLIYFSLNLNKHCQY